MSKLSLKTENIVNMRQTEDALLVLDKNGKLWFCEKIENFEKIWKLEKFTFTLRKKPKCKN